MAWWVDFLAEFDPFSGIDSESVLTAIDIGTGYTRAKRLEIARVLARHHTFYWTNGTRIAKEFVCGPSPLSSTRRCRIKNRESRGSKSI